MSETSFVVRASWVLTVDASDSVLSDGAVAVIDGRIAAVGPAAEVVAAHPALAVEHLEGHALLPGLINSHSHLGMNLFRGTADDRNLEDFLAVVVPLESQALTGDHVEAATRAAAVESVLAGVTTVLDMYFHVSRGIAGADSVGLRVLGGPLMMAGGPSPLPWEAVLEFATAWMDEHPARPGWRPVLNPHGTYTVTPEQLDAVRALRERHDSVLHIHLSESLAENQMIVDRYGRRPLAVLEDAGLLTGDTVLAHAVHLTPDERASVASVGAAVAHCPASNLKLASGVAHVPELLAIGATVGLGTDGVASSNDLDMFGAIRLAALLHKGAPSGPDGPDATNLPAATVIRMATMGGATALGIDGDTGSLEVGKLADLVAVDLDRPHTQPVFDPSSALVYAAGRGDVRHVWVEGEPVVRDGRTVSVDERDVVRELRRMAQELPLP